MTLELGGKSPVIIGKDADIARATERVAIGKMLNAGQICLAPDYMLVPEAQEQAVVDGLKAAVSSMYPTLLANPDYTAIINDRHHQRLQDWVADARAKGATVETVNPAGEDFAGSNARKMPLHIVRNATDDMIVMSRWKSYPLAASGHRAWARITALTASRPSATARRCSSKPSSMSRNWQASSRLMARQQWRA